MTAKKRVAVVLVCVREAVSEQKPNCDENCACGVKFNSSTLTTGRICFKLASVSVLEAKEDVVGKLLAHLNKMQRRCVRTKELWGGGSVN